MTGKLFVVSTPIGNLSDLSPRGVETLRTVDFIAAEDTRVGAKLLNKFDIKKPQISYYEHNRRQKGEYIAERLVAGESCALITDAGTPAISDPGTDLVEICASRDIEVVAVPGCSAVIAALSVSGMECGRFTFEGFLSMNKKSRREHLAQVKNEPRTMVFYEAPHKLLNSLKDMLDCFGDRKIALCREITKMHEQVVRTTLVQAIELYEESSPRGEFVLVIQGAQPEEPEQFSDEFLLGLVEERMSEQGILGAVKAVAKQYGVSKNNLYQKCIAKFG